MRERERARERERERDSQTDRQTEREGVHVCMILEGSDVNTTDTDVAKGAVIKPAPKGPGESNFHYFNVSLQVYILPAL